MLNKANPDLHVLHKNNSGNIVMNGSQRCKTGGPLMSQFPVCFLLVNNEH